MIAYERYTELISKHIHRTITDQEKADLEKYEADQPKTCPLCGAAVWLHAGLQHTANGLLEYPPQRGHVHLPCRSSRRQLLVVGLSV